MANTLIGSSIEENAAEIQRLHGRIHETLKFRDKSPAHRAEWEAACSEFHDKYDDLAFPGGFDRGLNQIGIGNEEAIENGLSFLEVRPYFFRSGYMFKALIPKIKKAPLTQDQKFRFEKFFKRYQEWRETNNDGT